MAQYPTLAWLPYDMGSTRSLLSAVSVVYFVFITKQGGNDFTFIIVMLTYPRNDDTSI